jgi:hypothetical protein
MTGAEIAGYFFLSYVIGIGTGFVIGFVRNFLSKIINY